MNNVFETGIQYFSDCCRRGSEYDGKLLGSFRLTTTADAIIYVIYAPFYCLSLAAKVYCVLFKGGREKLAGNAAGENMPQVSDKSRLRTS